MNTKNHRDLRSVLTASVQIDRRHSALLHRACRRIAPDIWLAARFLPRARRDPLLAVAGALRLLGDLVAGREVHSDRSTNPETGEGAAPSTGGCACGSGSLEMRTTVAHNVVEFLFEEAVPGSIGRPELEAFVATREMLQLAREPFDDYVDAFAASLVPRRLATRVSLDRIVDGLAVPIADLLCTLLLDSPPDALVRRQVTESVRFVLLSQALLTVRDSCLHADRFLIPLEDLAARGVRDTDLGAWLRGEAPAATPDDLEERCRQLMGDCQARCLEHLARGIHVIEVLPGALARAFAAFTGLWADAILTEPLGAAESSLTLPTRLKSHRFRAWRYAIGRRFDPRVAAALSGAVSAAPVAETCIVAHAGSLSHR